MADAGTRSASETLQLADWRRTVGELYAELRRLASADGPASAWEHWRVVRERLFREHSQSPVPASERAAFRARHWPYDPEFRFDDVAVRPAGPETPPGVDAAVGSGFTGFGPGLGLELPVSAGGTMAFDRIGFVDVPFATGSRTLAVYWMQGYAGGLFLPFRDATNGAETYGAGRYLLDAAKSADLGGDAGRSTLTLDFNFAFQPSCAWDPRWACPLAPPENRLDIPVPAGERIA